MVGFLNLPQIISWGRTLPPEGGPVKHKGFALSSPDQDAGAVMETVPWNGNHPSP